MYYCLRAEFVDSRAYIQYHPVWFLERNNPSHVTKIFRLKLQRKMGQVIVSFRSPCKRKGRELLQWQIGNSFKRKILFKKKGISCVSYRIQNAILLFITKVVGCELPYSRNVHQQQLGSILVLITSLFFTFSNSFHPSVLAFTNESKGVWFRRKLIPKFTNSSRFLPQHATRNEPHFFFLFFKNIIFWREHLEVGRPAQLRCRGGESWELE